MPIEVIELCDEISKLIEKLKNIVANVPLDIDLAK